jgi:hypothetical protein
MVGGIKSESWAASSRNGGRYRSESAAINPKLKEAWHKIANSYRELARALGLPI